MSLRLAEKAEEEGEEKEAKEDHGEQREAASPLTCDPSLTDVQPASLPSSKFYSACMYHSLLIHESQHYVTQSYTSRHTLNHIHTHTLSLFLGWLISGKGQQWVSMFAFKVSVDSKCPKYLETILSDTRLYTIFKTGSCTTQCSWKALKCLISVY